MRPLFVAAIATLCWVNADAGYAQLYPGRPIRLVVPWPAGGPPDTIGRLLGSRIGDALRQQIVVDNRPGANSVIGAEPVGLPSDEFMRYLVADIDKYRQLAIRIHLKFE